MDGWLGGWVIVVKMGMVAIGGRASNIVGLGGGFRSPNFGELNNFVRSCTLTGDDSVGSGTEGGPPTETEKLAHA